MLTPAHVDNFYSKVEFAAQIRKIVGEAEPLSLRDFIYNIQKEQLIEDVADTKALAEFKFNIIMETDEDAQYARLDQTLSEIMVLRCLRMPQFCSCGTKLHNGSRCCLKSEEKPVTFTRILLNSVQMFLRASERELPQMPTISVDKHSRFNQVLSSEQSMHRGLFTAQLGNASSGHGHASGRLFTTQLGNFVCKCIGERLNESTDTWGVVPGLVTCDMQQIARPLASYQEHVGGNMLLTQLLAQLTNLAALKNKNLQQAIYPQRLLQWPAGGGSQMLGQYHEVPLELQKRTASPPKKMLTLLDGPPGDADPMAGPEPREAVAPVPAAAAVPAVAPVPVLPAVIAAPAEAVPTLWLEMLQDPWVTPEELDEDVWAGMVAGNPWIDVEDE